jgi:hypothetical protein
MPLCEASCKLRWCEAVKARVWSLGVVVDPPCFDDFAGFGQASKQMLVEASSRSRPLKDSMKPFWVGLPGAM